ncbi:MAG: hypothetical protein KDI37_04665 [Xanthomonadales bacterium]|nr:hypothetical protein [Xanthomonadales bacterium]MCB1641004.1 hypothetical protein [Xanthomonadales bacterium]
MGKGRTPKWLYLVAALALIWNALGCMAFVQQAMLSDAQIDALPAAEAALYRGMPMWATIAFAVAVFGGATGSLALLFRQRFALILFTASLLGVLLQMFHLFILARGVEVLGAGALTMPGMIIVVAFALVWLARTAARRGWLD